MQKVWTNYPSTDLNDQLFISKFITFWIGAGAGVGASSGAATKSNGSGSTTLIFGDFENLSSSKLARLSWMQK